MLANLFGALLVIGVGLLFVDLVPLQENMVCEPSTYANTSECPDAVFSQTYFDARGKFRAAAKTAGAQQNTYTIVEEDGVQYTTDVAVVVGKKKGSLVVHISGTHGVEGFIGSAIQTDLLQTWNSSRADGATIVFIHAVNPYGMAHFRRFNEHNVDLNRNVMWTEAQWKEVLERDNNIAGYDNFKELLAPSEAPRLIDRYTLLVYAAYNIVKNGFVAMKSALAAGQYHHAEGLYFGGKAEERSVSVLKEIASAFRGFEKVVVIDVHSGLGPEGVDTFMVDSEAKADAARVVFADKKAFQLDFPASGNGGASSGYDLARGMLNLSPILGENIVYVTEEFGTVPGVFVARALILENAAYQHAKGSYIHRVTQDWLRDAFYPQKMSFKKSVLKRGRAAFDAAWTFTA